MSYSPGAKVVLGGETIIDLTGDTVTAAKILSGYTAHGKDGSQITGTRTRDDELSDMGFYYDEDGYLCQGPDLPDY